MHLDPPSVSRPSAYFAAFLLGAMALGIFIPFFLAVVQPYVRTGVPPADWTLPTIIIALGVVVLLLGYLALAGYKGFATVISETGVSWPTMRGRRAALWSEVRRIGVRGHELLLDTPQGTVAINPWCFSDAKGVAPYLQAQLAAHAARAKGAD